MPVIARDEHERELRELRADVETWRRAAEQHGVSCCEYRHEIKVLRNDHRGAVEALRSRRDAWPKGSHPRAILDSALREVERILTANGGQ